jgi:hypothetical protein
MIRGQSITAIDVLLKEQAESLQGLPVSDDRRDVIVLSVPMHGAALSEFKYQRRLNPLRIICLINAS